MITMITMIMIIMVMMILENIGTNLPLKYFSNAHNHDLNWTIVQLNNAANKDMLTYVKIYYNYNNNIIPSNNANNKITRNG